MKDLFIKENCILWSLLLPLSPKEGIGKYLKDSFNRKPNPGCEGSKRFQFK